MVLIVIFLNLFIIFYEWNKHSISIILWAMLFVVFTIPHTIYSFSGEYGMNTINTVSLFSMLFMLCYLIIRIIYFKYRKARILYIEKESYGTLEKSYSNTFFYMYMLAFLIIMFYLYKSGRNIMTTKWADGWHQTVQEHIAYLLMVSLSAVSIVFLMKKEYVKFVLTCIMYGLNLVISQSRYNLIGFFAPYLIYLLFSKSRKVKIRGVVLGVVIIFFVFLMQQYRWMGGFENAMNAGFEKLTRRALIYMKGGNGEFGLIRSFYYFVDCNNNLSGFGQGKGYMRLFMMPMPSSVFSFKPRDFAVDIYREWFRADISGGTMHPTLFGECYANFGFFGFLMGFFYAVLFCCVDEFLYKMKDIMTKTLTIGLCTTMAVIMGRGAVYNSITNCVIGLVIVYMIKLFYRIFIKNRRENYMEA